MPEHQAKRKRPEQEFRRAASSAPEAAREVWGSVSAGTAAAGGPSLIDELRRRFPQHRSPAHEQGTHGYKRSEQARLSAAFHQAVTGRTHQSEHTIGFSALNRSGFKRGENAEMKDFENRLPAYQELYAMHREHIGTGNTDHASVDARGFSSSSSYRDSQLAAVMSGATDTPGGAGAAYNAGVGNAIQLNQLGYANLYQNALPAPPDSALATQIRQANASFFTMMQALGSGGKTIPYYPAAGVREQSPPVSPQEAAEAVLSRLSMQTGRVPSRAIENRVRRLFHLQELPEKQAADTDDALAAEDEMEKLLDDMTKDDAR